MVIYSLFNRLPDIPSTGSREDLGHSEKDPKVRVEVTILSITGLWDFGGWVRL